MASIQKKNSKTFPLLLVTAYATGTSVTERLTNSVFVAKRAIVKSALDNSRRVITQHNQLSLQALIAAHKLNSALLKIWPRTVGL